VISARKGAIAIRRGETTPTLYQTMFERGSLAQLIVDIPSFRIAAVNAAFCAMTGFTAAERVGFDLALIFPSGQHSVDDIVRRLAHGSIDGYTAERFLQRRDGSLIPILSTVSVVRDEYGVPRHLLALVQDMTQQRGLEWTAQRGRALIDAAIATLPVSFAVFDTDLRLTFVAGGREREGVPAEAYVGKKVTEITEDDIAIDALRAALAGAESTSRSIVNGNMYLTLNAPMRDDAGDIIGVISVNNNITAEVSADAERIRKDDLRLFAARHDPLTGLLGRPGLVEHLSDLTFSGHRPGALLLLDLDDFNLVNDSLGHTIGDAVLLEVACRVSDAFPGWVVARYGADAFAVAAPLDVTLVEAADAAERVRAALDPSVEIFGHALRITASQGIALEQTRGSSTLLRNADSALAHAKLEGTGQCRFYDADMRREVQERIRVRDGLSTALRDGCLQLAYQPIVDLADRSTVGVEALLRWSHPERGWISPAEFIPIAEQTGLIVPIGAWVMNTACATIEQLRCAQRIYLAVNVSVRQFNGGAFAEWVEEVLNRSALPASALAIEVTESALMDDIVEVRTAFERLRRLGVRVAIDDFGTGYSSLARLQRLPVDIIKLDRAFVTGVDHRSEARAMAAAILQVSAAIGASIIAEGVETEAEAATLVDLGYDTAQGFLFGRPMPIADLNEQLAAEHLRG
jgi:diguanylate cyclase (GGDEF)-like protein/PAS domain S-box-containing protein